MQKDAEDKRYDFASASEFDIQDVEVEFKFENGFTVEIEKVFTEKQNIIMAQMNNYHTIV